MATGQVIQFPLRLGLVEDEGDKSRPVSSLMAGANIRWPKAGQIGKRWGTVSLPMAHEEGGSVTDIRRFIVRGDELSVTDGHTIYTYDHVLERWRLTTGLSELGLQWSTLVDDISSVAHSDVAIIGDLLIHAWVTGDPTAWPEMEFEPTDDPEPRGTAFVQVINWRTRQVVLKPQRLTRDDERIVYVRVLTSETYAFVLYSRTDGQIRYLSLDVGIQSIPVIAENSLILDLVATESLVGRFDALVLPTNALVVVYERFEQDTYQGLSAKRFEVAFGNLTEAAHNDLFSAGVDVRSLAIAHDTDNNFIGALYASHDYALGNFRVGLDIIDLDTLGLHTDNPDLQSPFAAWHTAIRYVGEGQYALVYSGIDKASNVGLQEHYPTLISAFVESDTGLPIYSSAAASSAMSLLSRIARVGERYYVLATDARYGERQLAPDASHTDEMLRRPSISSYVLEIQNTSTDELPPHRLVGKIDHDIASMFTFGVLPGAAVVDDDTVLAIAPFQATAAPVSFGWRGGLRLVTITSNPDNMGDPWRTVNVGQETYISAGVLSAWDGRSVFDYGMRTPYVIQSTTAPNAGSALANGNYIYQFLGTFRSCAGVLHRGPMSISVEATINVPNTGVEIWLAPHSIDGKQSILQFGQNGPGQAFIEIYRTTANGSTLYKLSNDPTYNIIPNQPNTNILTFIDRRNDDSIQPFALPAMPAVPLATRPQPYVATGELEDVQPPAPYTIHLHGERIGIITGGRREYWYSKDIRENPGIAPGFSPIQVELYSEDLVACATLDEKRIMFSAQSIWFVVGDGPTVTGADNRFQPPQRIQSPVGCTNPRSVVSMPLGIMFQHGTNIYLLTRGLQIDWIGRDVRDTLAAYPRITSAVLVAFENEVRFTCNDELDTRGIVLVYDYVRATWMTRSYPGGAAIVDAVMHGGAYHMATSDSVRVETTSNHLDDGVFVPSTVELAPISPQGGSLSWQRVRRVQVIGESLSNHQLSLSVARDFRSTPQQSKTFEAGSDVTQIGPLERAQLDLSVQKVQSLQVSISDSPPADTNAFPLGSGGGFVLDGVALLVQPKRGLPPITSSRRG